MRRRYWLFMGRCWPPQDHRGYDPSVAGEDPRLVEILILRGSNARLTFIYPRFNAICGGGGHRHDLFRAVVGRALSRGHALQRFRCGLVRPHPALNVLPEKFRKQRLRVLRAP